MAFTAGSRLSPYEILAQIGAGGMGDVYRAHDPRVGRDVAIKVSSEQFTDRFSREIHAVAALNHPNIATLYDVGPNYLVMELVEGPTLADRIRQGAIALDESLEIARQIADALEAAHEKGIVHRDLKPGNIKIRPDGTVKVLDFGLAKVAETSAASSKDSPTLSVAQTAGGVILGTAAYMSPEQARGKSVDKRADVWAFGVVLYEMLTGKQLFSGDTVSDTLAAVLKEEPDLEKVSSKVHPLLRRCLEKDPKKRLRDIGDAWQLLESAPEPSPVKRPWLAWSIAGVLLIAFLLVSFLHFYLKIPMLVEPIRAEITLPEGVRFERAGAFALSPDSRYLAFSAAGLDGTSRIWLRALDSMESRPLKGTESIDYSLFFWSADSRHIAFTSGGKLKKIAISGAPPEPLCALTGQAPGGSWNRDGVIIFPVNMAGNGLMRVSDAGGTTFPATKLNPARKERGHYFPAFLPDGKHFLYWCQSATPENQGIYIGTLDGKPEEQNSIKLMENNFGPVYVPSHDSGPGLLLFMQEQTLMAQAFDEKRLKLIGERKHVAGPVGSFLHYGYFSASTHGYLVYKSGAASQLSKPTWFDRKGKLLGTVGESGVYYHLALSPDESRVAVSLFSAIQSPSFLDIVDIYLLDFAQGNPAHFTYGKGNSVRPTWSIDGNLIIFASDREGVFNLYQKPTSGTKEEELLLKSNDDKFPTSWSSDGRFLLYTVIDPKTKGDLWAIPPKIGAEGKPLLQTEFNERDGRFSPNMRWIAYTSDESGNDEIWVRGISQTDDGASPVTSGKWQVTKGGGKGARWRRDSKELYYQAPDRRVMAVRLTSDTMFQAGTPESLFPAFPDIGIAIATNAMAAFPTWDVAKDGNKFLLPVPVGESSPSTFHIISNWTALLKK